jgi:tetratricopeptide (TPR) repeat protein
MRIAVSLDRRHDPLADQHDPDQGWSTGPGRVLLLPPSAPTSSALVHALDDGQPDDAILVLYPATATIAADRLDPNDTEMLDPRSDARIEASIARASALLDAERLDEAYDAYAAAERLMSEEYTPRRAEVLVCMAAIERQRGRLTEAGLLLDRALAWFPGHLGALQARIDLAHRKGDAVTAAALRARTVAFAESDDERAALLQSTADEILLAATDCLARARALRPGDRSILERLKAIHEASGRYEHAVNVAVMLAESMADPSLRARTMVGAADLCRDRLGHVDRAVALYEAAIADDPAIAGAFESIETVLLANQDWAGAERAYSRQLERLAERGLVTEQKELLRKLARLRTDQLDDTTGAILALDRLVTLDPNDLDARHTLATLLEQSGQPDLAMRCLEVTARVAPTDPRTFQAMHRVASRAGDIDRAYCACAVLVHLGEADLDEQILYQQYAPESSLPSLQPFDDDAWALLQPDDHDEAVGEVLRAIEPAAVALRIEELRAQRKLAVADGKDVQKPETSTLSAVRMVQWAARLLALELPDILARPDDVPGGIAMLPAERPLVVLGRTALSGRSLPELAFLVTRELAYVRAAGRIPTFYKSLGDMKALVVAAMELASARAPRSRNATSIAKGLQQKLSEADRVRVVEAVERLTRDRTQIDLIRWGRGVELIACRAALVAADDITVAARMLAVDGRASAGLSASDRVRDLTGFSVSQRFFALRRLLAAPTRGGQ